MSPGIGVGGRPARTATPRTSPLATAAHDERTTVEVGPAAAERWRPVPGYVGAYDVSDLGRVRSLDRIVPRAQHTMRVRGRVLAPYSDGDGYRVVTLCEPGRARCLRVHVLVLTAFVGPRPAGAQSCHESGDQTDNRRANLSWCSAAENQLDSVRHGTHAMARRTHCPRGHALAAPNLIRAHALRGHRACLACDRALSYAWRARRAGFEVDVRALADSHLAAILAPATEPERGAA